MKIKSLIVLSALGCALIGVAGCGSGGPPQLEQASAKEVSDMTALRGIFDRVKGDYAQTTADEKKRFLDYAKGDQAAADRIWATMGNPRGGGAGATKPFSNGPGGQVLPPGSGRAGG